MVRINGAEYDYNPGMSLKELLNVFNADRQKQLAFDGFVVVVNSTALTAAEAEERILLDNDNIIIVPLADGG